jgi:hypothetical protein
LRATGAGLAGVWQVGADLPYVHRWLASHRCGADLPCVLDDDGAASKTCLASL